MRTIGFNARAIALAAAFALPLFGQLADGDRHYANRAEGASGGVAKAGPIDAAIAAYQRAIAQNANDLEAHARLLRAYRFKGAYVATSVDDKKKIYGTAKGAGEQALAAVGRSLASRNVKADAPEKTYRRRRAAGPRHGRRLPLGRDQLGRVGARVRQARRRRQGAADRIKRGATIAELADPKLEAGAPSRVLGRLHDQTPRIPFITGWASGRRPALPGGVAQARSVEQAHGALPGRGHGVERLEDEAAGGADAAHDRLRAERSEFLVEDEAAVRDAKALLKQWGA